MYSYIFLIIFSVAECSDLRNGAISNYISSIAIYKNRAFFALPRSSCHKNENGPTLIETNWNVNSLALNSGKKFYFKQIWEKCDHLQNVVSLDVEAKKSRLWILDNGNDKCLPKLVVYNLYGNYEVQLSMFYNFTNDELTYLTVDPLTEFGTLCYIGMKTSNKIIVFSWDNRSWSVVTFNSGQVHPQRIALSKSSSRMFITFDKSDELLALNLSDVRNVGGKGLMLNHKVGVVYIGKKLGPSTGMVIDAFGGLNYFLPRDFAVVRWTMNKQLSAEHHDVLLQSFETLPHVSHLFNDPFNNVWALVNPVDSDECLSDHDSKFLNKSRVVQLSTFFKRPFKTKTLKFL